MKLKTNWKRSLCLLLSLLLVLLSASSAFALNGAYPGDINEPTAKIAAGRTDTLLLNAAKALNGTSLTTTVFETLYSDETLSSILLSVYGAAQDQSALSGVGLDLSPAAAAKGLSAYGSVAARLSAAESWADVDLSGARWGVSSKDGFAAALSAMFTPMNDLLYMLLCGGTFRLGLLPIVGDQGYANGVIPMLSALGCTLIPDAKTFCAKAASDRSAMVRQMVLSLLSLVDALTGAPMAKLTAVLPDLAIFIRDGGLEAAVDALLRPLSLHIGPYISLFSGSKLLSVLMFLQSPGEYTLNFTENVTKSVNDMLQNSGVSVAEIDLDALAACKGNATDCFMVVMRWLIASLRRNQNELGGLLSGAGMDLELSPVLTALFRHSDEGLLSMYIGFLTDEDGTEADVLWKTQPFTRGEVTFTEHLTRKNFKKVLKGLDGVLDEFVSGFGQADSLQQMLGSLIYSGDTVTALAKGLYGALAGEETAQFAAMLSLPATPAALASVLPARYGAAKRTLSQYSDWNNLKTVAWGFTAGSRSGFLSALTAVLSPVRPLLEAFLANGTLPVFGALRIGGTNGYNTAVIPLLEALSCPAASIKTYDQYVTGKGTDRILTDLLTPLLDLIDAIIDRPVYTVTKILPNALFFFQNGSLQTCLEALLVPLTALLGEFSLSPEALGLDFSDFTELDLPSLLSGMTASSDVPLSLDGLDLSLLASLGKQTEMQSKRTYRGEAVTVSYIKSDQPAVLLTLLRGIIDTVKQPENADLLNNLIAGSSGDNAMFAQYSAGIGDEMADMTTDEVIEWLYQLLFRERAKKEIKEDDGYVPDFTYEPEPTHTVRNVLIAIGAVLVLAAGIVLLWRRKEIAAWRSRRKAATAIKTTRED